MCSLLGLAEGALDVLELGVKVGNVLNVLQVLQVMAVNERLQVAVEREVTQLGPVEVCIDKGVDVAVGGFGRMS